MNNSKERILWVDIARITAIFLVILIHSVDSVVYHWGKSPFLNEVIKSWWLTGVAFKSLASVCVPLLFMLSGYLLLSANDAILFFFKKRLTKILIPLFVWSILYMIWDGAFTDIGFTLRNLKFAIRGILEGSVHFHLWFLYSIIGLYIVTPILRRFIQTAPEVEIQYFIGLWFFSTIFFSLAKELKAIHISLFAQPFVSGFLGYYVAGYYLGKKEYSSKQIWVAFCVVLISVIGKTFWAYQLTHEGGSFDTNLFEYLKWHTIIISFASFITLKGMNPFFTKTFSPRLSKMVIIISGSTFGIYLVHIQILKILDSGALGFQLNGNIFHPLLGTPLTVLVTFLLSFAISYILKKIPIIKMIVP